MPLTLTASSTLEAAKVIASKLADSTESSRKLYEMLLALSFDVIQEKAYRAIPTHVTYHSSLTLCAAVAGIDRVTAWRGLVRLKALGVVDWRSHKGRLLGKARNTGTVFQVRLNPLEGARAKLSYEDLKHQYKDLERLAKAKQLSQQVVQHIQALQEQPTKYLLLKQWTLTPYSSKTPLPYTLQHSLEALLDVNLAPKEKVNEAVDLAAVALSQALRDSKGINWYRKLLWQVLRHSRASQEDVSYSVYLAAKRAAVDAREGFARKPGALFTSRLKKFDWWCAVIEGPPTRVGVRPTA